MDDHKQLPDEQEGKADQHDACHHTYHDGNDVRSSRALCNRDKGDLLHEPQCQWVHFKYPLF